MARYPLVSRLLRSRGHEVTAVASCPACSFRLLQQDKFNESLLRLDAYLDKFELAHKLEQQTKMRKSHLFIIAVLCVVAFLFYFLGLEFVRFEGVCAVCSCSC